MPRIITLTPNPALDYSVEVDAVTPNRKLNAENVRVDPGGGGVNVARAAHRLGAETLAIFPAGGPLGETLCALVQAEGVAARAICVNGQTRLSFAARDRRTKNEYRFGLPGAALSEAEAAMLLDALDKETSAGDFVVGSGSLPPTADPGAPRDLWARAAAIAARRQAKFALDTTSGEAEALAEGLYLIRKNKTELSTIAGRELDWPDETARFAQDFVASHKIERIVITHGGDGAIMASRKNFVRAPGLNVPIVSAVGAGDSFVAALCASLMRGDSDAQALRRAMAAASAALMTPGTQLFDPGNVEKLMRDHG
ncbi:MAG: hexose kinase [Parvularculaceae bacterium]